MKGSIVCLLMVIGTLLDPAVAHFWPNGPHHEHHFHSMPSENMEQSAPFNALNGVPMPGLPAPLAPSFAANRHWRSDGVFLFRPLLMSAWNNGLPEQQRLHSPLLERLLSSPSPYRRSRFINFYKDLNMEPQNGASIGGRRRRRVKGLKGEINVKWAVMPIFERGNGAEEGVSTENNGNNNDKPQPQQAELLRRFNRESMMFPHRRSSFPSIHSASQMQPQPQQPSFGEADETSQEASPSTFSRRYRRQISWNPQPLFNRLLSNATGLFDTIGRQMSRQLHTSADGAGRAMNGVFNSLQENFKRFTNNLNISQFRPERILSQIASLTKSAQT